MPAQGNSADSVSSAACVAQEYEIKAVNVAYFVNAIKRLNKRARKIGVSEITWEIVGRRRVAVLGDYVAGTSEREIIGYDRLTTLSVVGESPVLSGYAIAAVIEHTGGGNLLRDASGGSVDLSEYRDSGAHCDHCNVRRNRRETVVLIKDDQSVVRVGKSCLKDYLGHATIAQFAWRADLVCLLGEVADLDDSGSCYGSSGPDGWDLLDFLSWCAASARESGYVTRGAARDSDTLEATADSAWGALSSYYMRPRQYQRDLERGIAVELLDIDREAGRLALDWTIADLSKCLASDDGLNDFQHNLSVIAKMGFVEHSHAGYACAILGYHTRGIRYEADKVAREAAKLERELEKLERMKVAKHLGVIGEKLLVEVVIGRTIHLPDYGYGCSYLVTMQTLDSNDALSWKASANPRLLENAKLWIRGTERSSGV